MALPDVSYPRRVTREVRVGDITIGGDNPVVVQSMITEETHNVPAAVEQIISMHQAGAEIVRVTTPNLAEARCLEEIKLRLKRQYRDVPLVADVLHQGSDIAVEVAKYVDKIRINPGLFVFRKRVQRTLDYSEIEIQEELEAIETELADFKAANPNSRLMASRLAPPRLSSELVLADGFRRAASAWRPIS